jgi:hypothetical protein
VATGAAEVESLLSEEERQQLRQLCGRCLYHQLNVSVSYGNSHKVGGAAGAKMPLPAGPLSQAAWGQRPLAAAAAAAAAACTHCCHHFNAIGWCCRCLWPPETSPSCGSVTRQCSWPPWYPAWPAAPRCARLWREPCARRCAPWEAVIALRQQMQSRAACCPTAVAAACARAAAPPLNGTSSSCPATAVPPLYCCRPS